MSTDFIMFFIFTPSMVVLGIIGYFVALTIQKKRKQEAERKKKEQWEKEQKERWDYLDTHPIAKEVFWEQEYERINREMNRKKSPIWMGFWQEI